MPMYFQYTPHPALSALLSDGHRLRRVVFICVWPGMCICTKSNGSGRERGPS